MTTQVKPGKYAAKIIDADLWKSKKGDPVAVIMFEFSDEDQNPKRLTWFGSLTGGAREITVRTLVTCGFKSDDLSDLTMGKGYLASEKEFEIKVENKPNPNKGNALEPRIQWIGLPGGAGGFRERMTKEDAVKLCGGLSLKADFMEAREKLGIKKVEPTTMTQAELAESELGF